jgi:hypothetical protein
MRIREGGDAGRANGGRAPALLSELVGTAIDGQRCRDGPQDRSSPL